jgi:hypothetical protein
MYRTYYSIRSSIPGYFHNSWILSVWPSKVYPNWSTTKISQGVRTSSWYSKIGWRKFPTCSVYYGNLRYGILLPQVLDGCYSLAWDTKEIPFSLSILSSCRELLVLLSIMEHFKVLNKSSSPQLDNKVHMSIAQIKHFLEKGNPH